MPIIGSIDQGTSSSRFLIFDSNSGKLLDSHQEEIKQIAPEQSWLEEDPEAIYHSVKTCVDTVIHRQKSKNPSFKVDCVGITNQRETTVIWDKISGKPLYNAILWCDGRTKSTVDTILNSEKVKQNQNILQNVTGLPISTYFSALKVRWLLDHVPEVKNKILAQEAMFGTIDTWLVYKLTQGQKHVTDPTNACRTMLYSLDSNQFDAQLLNFFEIPETLILPEIQPSSSDFGVISDLESLKNVPISGILGDQQAALVGQQCLRPGMLKNTYGTGCFLLQNTGTQKIFSKHGLLTTVGYQKADGTVIYALEGAVAIAGLLTTWLMKQLQLISNVKELNAAANAVENSGGVFIVPAFGGLFCPHWDTSARGVICGLTQFSDKNHICRAALESVAFQVKDVIEAMQQDGQNCLLLKADGGMTNSDLLMQIQSDILNIPVMIPSMKESTALGAAVAAGCYQNIWTAKGWELFSSTGAEFSEEDSNDSLESRTSETDSAISGDVDGLKFNVVKPNYANSYSYEKWQLAVEKSKNWEN